MAFEDGSPGQLDVVSRENEIMAEYRVHVPDEEAGQESKDS